MPTGGTATQHTHPEIIREIWSKPGVLLLMVGLFQCCPWTSKSWEEPFQGEEDGAGGGKGIEGFSVRPFILKFPNCTQSPAATSPA